METVAVCSSNFKKNERCLDYIEFEMCDSVIPIALLDVDQSFEKVPEDGVVVEINAFSCNYRDKSIVIHSNDKCRNQSVSGNLYYYPVGSEFVGKVVEIGNEVKHLRIGDRVIPDGAYPLKADGTFGGLPTNCASQRFQMLSQAYLKKIPDTMSDEVAAAFTIAGQTVYSMLRKLDLKFGQSILVTAATSNTSLAVISALRKYNVNIYACSTSDANFDKLKELGVNECITKSSLESRETALLTSSFGGFDAVIDPFFDLYLYPVFGHIKNGGKYITCGLYAQNGKFENQNKQQLDFGMFLGTSISQNISIIGNCLGTTSDLDMALKDFEAGIFDIRIDSVWDKSNLLHFFQKTFHQVPRLGKVIFKYD
ncbi:MDR/zinc-dependent alcohol dehydrogenase-like family protein [Parapedobacter tibetensis]|uniref:MDR/zinc-dependent alcohol dehydrogenase-like family protein n=1 Tax=Parapedobacter tibetensis TaxID=2972951 RepID=UPI00214D7CD1|nr:medium chain dehydrogenase/reductase family protein [Parapedobacter tibetensis]